MSDSSPSPAPSPCPSPAPPPSPSQSHSVGNSNSSPYTSVSMETSSSTGTDPISDMKKRLKSGDPSPSPPPSPTARMIKSSGSTSRRTMEPSSSKGMESNKRLKTGDSKPVEFFDQNFPPRIPFIRKDLEVLGFLRKKIFGIPLPPHQIIEANVYEHHPVYIADLYDLIRETFRYFFTPGHGVGSQSLNWKPSSPSIPIVMGAKLLGFKKGMAYFEGNEITDWRIVEYSLIMDGRNLPTLNWTGAVCLLYRKSMLDKSIQQQTADQEVKKENNESDEEKSED